MYKLILCCTAAVLYFTGINAVAGPITTSANISALSLANVLLAPSGFTPASATLSVNSIVSWFTDCINLSIFNPPGNPTGITQTGAQSGVYTTIGSNAYNLSGPGVVLSSGNVLHYSSGQNTCQNFSSGYQVPATAGQSALLSPVTGQTFHYDVAQLDITFAAASVAAIAFDVVFGSEEFPNFIGTAFIDGFGLYLNGVNIAMVTNLPINIAHPNVANIPETELDGVLVSNGSPKIRLLGNTIVGNNTLTFIIADAQDWQNDATVYIEPMTVVFNGDCPEDPTAKLTAVVGGNGFKTVQDAYDAATNGAVIGIFSNTTENVVLGGDKTLKITQCTTARVTAKDSSQPVWTISSTGKLTIVSPDAVGGSIGWLIQTDHHDIKSVRATGASDTGIHIVGNDNRVSFNSVSGGPIGVQIDGDNNIVKGGTVSGNSGDGVVIGSTGRNNTFSGANVQNNGGNGIVVDGSTNNVVKDNSRVDSNGKNGILVNGNGNMISNNAAGSDKGKGNGLDGIKVVGTGTTLDKNRANANAGNGVTITSAAIGTRLKGNQSNQTASGGSKENGGFEYGLGTGAINQGGNKADNISIPSAKKCPTFPATGTKCQ